MPTDASNKKPNIVVGMRVKLRDSEYPGHGTVTMLHPPDDRPAYRGQTWFEVRWDDFGGDEGTESDHRDTDLAPVVEPQQSFEPCVGDCAPPDNCSSCKVGLFAPVVEPQQPKEVWRPALLPGELPIEYGVRCIEWERQRIIAIIEDYDFQRDTWRRDLLAAIKETNDE